MLMRAADFEVDDPGHWSLLRPDPGKPGNRVARTGHGHGGNKNIYYNKKDTVSHALCCRNVYVVRQHVFKQITVICANTL